MSSDDADSRDEADAQSRSLESASQTQTETATAPDSATKTQARARSPLSQSVRSRRHTAPPTQARRSPRRQGLKTPRALLDAATRQLGVTAQSVQFGLLGLVVAAVVTLYGSGVDARLLGGFTALVGSSYGICQLVPPRESRNVLDQLENLYRAERLAVAASGIAAVTVCVTALLIAGVAVNSYVGRRLIAETSVTIATGGLTLGLIASYSLVRALVARAVPVQSNRSFSDRAVTASSLFEFVFLLAAIGTPVYIYTAAFVWNRPELVVIPVQLSHTAGALLLSGLLCVYVALVSRL